MKNEKYNLLEGTLIEEIRVQSFFLNRQMVSDLNVLFIKTHRGDWLSLSAEDGVNNLVILSQEPFICALDKIDDEFAYPVQNLETDYTGRRITGIKEYLYSGKTCDVFRGFFISLEQHPGFSLYETDDEVLILRTGIITMNDSLMR